MFWCAVGTESEFNISQVRVALGRMVERSWEEVIEGDITVRDIILRMVSERICGVGRQTIP